MCIYPFTQNHQRHLTICLCHHHLPPFLLLQLTYVYYAKFSSRPDFPHCQLICPMHQLVLFAASCCIVHRQPHVERRRRDAERRQFLTTPYFFITCFWQFFGDGKSPPNLVFNLLSSFSRSFWFKSSLFLYIAQFRFNLYCLSLFR